MKATLVITHNPFHPQKGRTLRTLTKRRCIAKLAPQTDRPFICLYNGTPLLRADWNRRIKDGDVVSFMCLPQGGGGNSEKQILRTIATIAIVVATQGMGASLMGIGGAAAFGATGLTVANAAFTMGALALFNAVLPVPKPPTAQTQAAMASPSPTYSLQAQGNVARLGQSIPVQYGRHIAYPDFAAAPYTEFVANEQYLNQLLCIGQGYYEVEAIRFEDTPITNYDAIEYEIIEPGGTVTLFPTDVITSAEVGGIEALTGVPLGPFVVNPANADVNYIAIDTVCPKGLFYANDDGSLSALSVRYQIEARAIDSSGSPIGSWFILGEESFQSPTITTIPSTEPGVAGALGAAMTVVSAATNTPQRRSTRFSVPLGRYEARFTRLDTKDASSRAAHDLYWSGLRSFVPGTQQYGDLTMLAMRIRATSDVSQAASRKINVISTRKLPIWNGTTWSAPTATRSIAWALADAARNTKYGAKRSDALINLDQLLVLDAVWAARGDRFDARFDNAITFWEAVQKIARAGRAKPFQQSGLFHVVRDQEQAAPYQFFTPRNTVKGSLKIDYLMPTAETADSIEVTFFNEITWMQDTVVASLPGSTAETPAKVELFGVTGHDQAWREGMYIAASNRYRRKPITLSTELEGQIPTFGDLVSVVSERLTAAQSGEIVSWDAGTLTLETSEPLAFKEGANYFGLRRRDGSRSGPWLCTPGFDAYHAVLNEKPDFTPYTEGNEERTHYSFGIATEYEQPAILLGSRPRGNTVEITLINEYYDGDGKPYVHYADTGVPPTPLAPWQLPTLLADPTMPTDVTISETLVDIQGIIRTRMDVTWKFDPKAEGYRVAWRVGTGDWNAIADTSRTTASLLDSPVNLVEVRVIAYTGTRTSKPAYASKELLGKTAKPANVMNFRLDSGSLRWDKVPDLDLSGYEVRFNYGSNTWWDSATPLHTDLLLASPWPMTSHPSGPITLLIKARDTSMNFSQDAAYIVTELGDVLAANIFADWPQAPTFTGVITNGSIVGGELVAHATDLFFGPDMEPFYGIDTDPFFPDSTYEEMRYEWTITTPTGLDGPGNRVLMLHAITGNFNIEYSRADQSAFFGADGDLFFGPDDEPFFGPDPIWTAWPGSIEAYSSEIISFRITTAAGPVQGVISLATPQIDVPDIVETINNLHTLAAGTRLPITKTYRVIKNVQHTIQYDGNGGLSARTLDKNAVLGPLIAVYNDVNTAVNGFIDATVQGY